MNIVCILKRCSFRKTFPKSEVDEPDTDDTIAILRGLKDSFESHHGVQITLCDYWSSHMSERYITDRYQIKQ
ncbi:MAG: hypothetical protein ACLUIS_12130 [Longibaculum sp.]